MRDIKSMNLTALITVLDEYPLCSACFQPYLEWLGKQPNADLEKNALIVELSQRDNKKIERLEEYLSRSRETLGLSTMEFLKDFGFSNDLLTVEPEKVHDILAEPILVLHLSDYGFEKIRKLPSFIKHQGNRIASADFVAFHSGKKYAIELKTVHKEKETKRDFEKRTGYPPMPCHWDVMLWNSLINKIEDKKNKVMTQLTNTKNHYSCDYTMLALYTRRITVAALVEPESCQNILKEIKAKYPKIDYVFMINYLSRIIVYPELGT